MIALEQARQHLETLGLKQADVTLNQREQARLQVFNSLMDFQLPRP